MLRPSESEAVRSPSAEVSERIDIDFIRRIVTQGGPQPEDYTDVTTWFSDVHSRRTEGQLSDLELSMLRESLGAAMSPLTMHGFVYTKPHGYAGDYEIIDKIYRSDISSEPSLAKWDHYFHQCAAPKAVRNRKSYFHRLLDEHSGRCRPLRVLKIASGPGRSMFEWLSSNPTAQVTFDCVEIDPNAIRYASDLNRQFLDRINFIHKNALRFRPTGTYDLIWAAGIFDYFVDKIFLSLLARLLPAVVPGGELVLGNFSPSNATRPYMEFCDWMLHHRSADELRSLAIQSGAKLERIKVGSEPEGVNLFLHISGQ